MQIIEALEAHLPTGYDRTFSPVSIGRLVEQVLVLIVQPA